MNDILIVDDERDIRELVSDILKDEGFATRIAANSTQAMAALSDRPPALLILDIWLKDSKMDGIDILTAVRRDNPEIPVVIISGHGNIEIAVAAIKQGAYDFIEKPFNIDQLLVVIKRAMETARLRRENVSLKRDEQGPGHMLGQSSAFRAFLNNLSKVSKFNGRVMLHGAAGSGKELAARFIHAQSGRASGPFIIINCGVINPELMEHVLFGQENDRGVEQGLLEEANDGVIYFNDVASLPLAVQPKLLRVLVDQRLQRVGGTKRIKVDFRVISSANRDVDEVIEAGRFRQDLYNRLNVVPIDVPSLDERRDDIPLLAEHFIQLFSENQGLPLRELSDQAAEKLQTMNWPGNVRQLKNVIERVLILSDDSEPIDPYELEPINEKNTDEEHIKISGHVMSLPLREAREVFERTYLFAQISRFGGNISKTAEFVGMERSAFHRKMRMLGVGTSAKDGTRVVSIIEAGDDDPEASRASRQSSE